MIPPQHPLWREALAQVPGGLSAGRPAISVLAGGTTNATFRIVTGEGAFVLRLHEPYSAELGVDRRREAVLHAAAAAAGLASRVIVADPGGRYLISEYLDAPPWQVADLADQGRLRELAQTLQRLHALSPPAVVPLDLAALLERHVAGIAALDPPAGQALAPQVAHACATLARLADAGRAPCIVHGDPAHSNLIGTRPLRLIDWEYATIGDPLVDLACLLAYYPQLEPHAARLLAHCGLTSRATVTQLADLASVYRLTADLWYRRLELARRHLPPAH